LERSVNASGQLVATGPLQALFGPPDEDLAWVSVLTQIENLADFKVSRQGAPVAITFEPDAIWPEQGALRPAAFEGRVMLPTGGALSGVLRRLSGSKPAKRFPPDSFTLSLLTFLERPRRIGIVSDDTQALKARLIRHSPWHNVVEMEASGLDAGNFDLVIVDLKRREHRMRAEQNLAALQTGLVIITDGSLTQFDARSSGQKR
jgi:hypothetical protein